MFMDLPENMEVQEEIIERVLKNTGAVMQVRIVKHRNQYEAALFTDNRYKPGPPLPRPLEEPSDVASHWMGVRPKVGLSAEEAEKIIYEVNGINALYRIQMKDTWGQDAY